AEVDSFKRCGTSNTFDVEYRVRRDLILHRSSMNNSASLGKSNTALTNSYLRRYLIKSGLIRISQLRRDLLGLDGAFIKGPLPGQVLAAVGLDLNNRIYPLSYALVEAESKSSWCWFLQCLGDDIDLHPNSNFTFSSDRQKGIVPAIKTMYPSAKHKYCCDTYMKI
ncbi:chloroplast stem-loop binding protein of 41 kDa b, chloroplastic, partial [Tanacetum coccineum]